MALKISGASIRHPVPALVLFTVLLVLGVLSFRSIPITRAPNVDVPIISVLVTQAGAAPAELETQVTRKIEDAIASVAGVKHITSSVTDGASTTLVELRLEVSTDRALNDVKDAVAKIRADLPRTIEEPITQRVDVVGQAIQTFAASAPGMTVEQLSWFIDDTVIRALQGVQGVGQVERIGGVSREIEVDLDPDRLASLGVTAGDINAQLRATNVELAGGRGEVGGHEQAIRTLANAPSVAALAESRIVLPGGREVRLSDVATITDGFEEPRKFARLNGTTPIVAFAIHRAKGASDVTVGERVRDRLAILSAAHPGVALTLIDDSVRGTYGGYVSAMHSLLEGALLATIVVFIFLRDWRATLLAAVALPLSVLPTFFFMELMGFSLNFVSLLAITLVTGILVDDAIVEIENIVRHIRMGKSAWHAAVEAADEIGLAVVAITLTIVAVFAPVSFMSGIAGQYFKQFGLTVAAAVLVSLLVARLLTPVMAAYFLRPHGPAHDRPDGLVMRGYRRLLGATLARPYITLFAGLVLFGLSLWSTTLLPTGFIPPQDDSRIVMSLELPPGATLADTRAKTDAVARLFQTEPGVTTIFVVGGATPTGAGESIRTASMVVGLVPKGQRSRSQKTIEEALSRHLATVPDLHGWLVNDRGERELSVTVLGDDPAALNHAVAKLEGAMRRLPSFRDVAANAGVDRPEIRVVPRNEEATRFGVSTETIADAIRIATIGDIAANLAKYRDGDRLIPIRVQLDPAARTSLAALEVLPVPGTAGLTVPLAAVADLGFGAGPSSIERYDRVRRVLIGADLARGEALGAALEKVYALPEARNLPPGVRVQSGGDAEIMGEVFDGFTSAMGAGLLMVMAVLVLLFGDIFQPVTILLSLPLSIGGVILALLLTGEPLSMPVVIGVLMLIGIVTKNAIMLVDFAIEARAKGIPRRQAITEAGTKRARPIVMTTVAMVAGMVPSALGIGDGGEFRAPMAIGVIGGLVVSTLLSLVFVPSFYTVMDDLSGLAKRLGRRATLEGAKQPAE
ncbi:efflux RND transporter permease subunit [Acidisphaera sp. L21]|uniref:efflux RND transporter permease subunit n=1 Tax=Acidisphaera sp. L21 TaxID=1641851 RepID=UPI00131A81D2|nr:efflux RND transporter permease subunit [Acidisphaera sp. L21]